MPHNKLQLLFFSVIIQFWQYKEHTTEKCTNFLYFSFNEQLLRVSNSIKYGNLYTRDTQSKYDAV